MFKQAFLRFHSNTKFVRFKSYSSSDYCINIVRTLDNENYLCTLLLPTHLRRAAMAIRAFNVEIATVQDQVSKPQLGLMRLKFWSDTLEKIYSGKLPNNPVAVELSQVVHKFKLSKQLLDNLVISRVNRLDQPSFQSIKDMTSYAESSCSSVYLLLMQAAKIESQEALLAANHMGKAQGLTNLIRGVPHCVQSRSLSLPSDLLVAHDISEEAIFRGNAPQALNLVVREVYESACFHLDMAREVKSDLTKEAKLILLPGIAAQRYLSSLKNSQYNVFDGGIQVKDPFLPFKLYISYLLKSY